MMERLKTPADRYNQPHHRESSAEVVAIDFTVKNHAQLRHNNYYIIVKFTLKK